MSTQDSAYTADRRFYGYMGARTAQELRIAEAMSLEPGDYESFSRPAPRPWVVAEEAATYVPCTDVDTKPRSRFFAWLQASRDLKTEVIEALRSCATRAYMYSICDQVVEFDNSIPAWMQDAHECAQHDLTPMGSLFDHVARAFDEAEARLSNG